MINFVRKIHADPSGTDRSNHRGPRLALLWGHIGGGTQYDADASQREICVWRVSRRFRLFDLGQAKVENLGVTSLGYKDVRLARLEVPVDDALRMGAFEGLSDLNGLFNLKSEVEACDSSFLGTWERG